MSRPTVAVVIPFYRDDRWFPEALASVMAQTVAADEVIVVDDCSPPGCATTLDGPLPPTVRVLRQPEKLLLVARHGTPDLVATHSEPP